MSHVFLFIVRSILEHLSTVRVSLMLAVLEMMKMNVCFSVSDQAHPQQLQESHLIVRRCFTSIIRQYPSTNTISVVKVFAAHSTRKSL